ncbi:MAG: hypothetical protein ACAI25_19350 [Planctomycetota bacterium]
MSSDMFARLREAKKRGTRGETGTAVATPPNGMPRLVATPAVVTPPAPPREEAPVAVRVVKVAPPPQPLIEELVAVEAVEEDQPSSVVPRLMGLVSIAIGGFFVLLGLLSVLAGEANAARAHSPTYTVWTGAFVVGGLMILKGLWRVIAGAPRKAVR